MFTIDVAGALVKLYTTLKRDKELMNWLNLFISTFYSGLIAFLGIDGAMLIAGKTALLAKGYGLVSAATAILGVVLRSPQGRSMVLSLPQKAVVDYQEAVKEGQVTIAGKDVRQ
jgi:hypothetical protein